jgi:hypothetical protein
MTVIECNIDDATYQMWLAAATEVALSVEDFVLWNNGIDSTLFKIKVIVH